MWEKLKENEKMQGNVYRPSEDWTAASRQILSVFHVWERERERERENKRKKGPISYTN